MSRWHRIDSDEKRRCCRAIRHSHTSQPSLRRAVKVVFCFIIAKFVFAHFLCRPMSPGSGQASSIEELKCILFDFRWMHGARNQSFIEFLRAADASAANGKLHHFRMTTRDDARAREQSKTAILRSAHSAHTQKMAAMNGGGGGGGTAVVYRFSLWSINDSIYDYKFKSSHIYSHRLIAMNDCSPLNCCASCRCGNMSFENVNVVATELHRRAMSLMCIFNTKLYTIKWCGEGRSHRELYADHFTFWIAI